MMETCPHLSYAILDEHGYATEHELLKKVSDI
jgi:hypothetical protein